ncbi:LacI family DNA-binding transcriptional regulator [Saccharopolyspora hirsuta]|uniref:LacI family transcriptional regulator n=1 Tax=Saccharopolyspora hirsuta TaxID=1837 RepID=A0A5M7CA27_SACHI|nr:LacI family DNA-binding transcriptional regulator [Saccharopolyspora hirsuta]KAA5835205.1 LacI family transcriptional regulator [Saccharopolyspora hirsuta]
MTGKSRGGSGAVSIKDVARHAGVSIATVSNALNRPELLSAATRGRVLSAIDQLGYVRSESARQLRAGRSRVLGLLVLDMGNPFFVDVARGAEDAAHAADVGVMLCNSGQDPAAEAMYLSLFAEHRVRGVLVTPTNVSGENLAAFRRRGIPYVYVDRVAADDEDSCSVSVDDVAGGELAVRHLLDRGHERIAFVTGPMSLAQCRDRLAGARSALSGAGLPEEALSVVETTTLDVTAGRDAGSRLLGLRERPTAVFCANDLLALGVLQAMFAAGVRVPEDIAIVGYDDIEFAAAAAVPLTSVRQPARQLGRKAAELLLAETSGQPGHTHERVVFQPELVVRRSTLRG